MGEDQRQRAVNAGTGIAASALAGFRVAGFNDEGSTKPSEYTEPVAIQCGRCGAAQDMGWRDNGGADRTAPLNELVAWAYGHECHAGEGSV